MIKVALRNHPKLNILALYQSDREVTASDRFVGPLIRLANKGHNVHLISTSKIDTTGSLICHRGRDVPFPVVSSLPFLIYSMIASLLIVKKGSVNLFLCGREEDLLVGWLVRKLKGCRLVYYAHGDSITIQQLVSTTIASNLKVSLSKVLERILLPKTDLIIVVSQHTKLRFLSRSNADSQKIVVVYNQILPGTSRSTQLAKKFSEERKRLIGYVGHFSRLKGVETLLHAFFSLSKSLNDVVLILVGDGSIREYLEDLTTQMGLRDKVVFTGWVKNPLDYLRDFYVLVVPSLHEGCPSVIPEAFSLDVPVLGSKAGGIPELLNRNELMFQPTNHNELASKLKMLLVSNTKYAQVKELLMDRKKIFVFDHTSMIEQLFLQCLEKSQMKCRNVAQ